MKPRIENFEQLSSGLLVPRGLGSELGRAAGRPTDHPNTLALQDIARRHKARSSQALWDELIYEQVGSGPTLTAAAEALLVSDVSIPPAYMVAKRILCVRIFGKASNAVTTPGTLTLRIRWGGLAGVVLVASNAMTQNVIVQTDKTWFAEADIQCLTEGATGTFLTCGRIVRGNQAAAAVADMVPDMWPAASLAPVTVDTTILKLLSITAQPSLATASITCMGYQLYSRS